MNRVTEHTGSKYPIIQAPMGWIARSQLASAVCNAGGFGIIETSSGEVDNCKAEIEKMSDQGDYDEFFKSAMKKFGIKSPSDLDDDEKKKFFNYVDKNYKAKKETD